MMPCQNICDGGKRFYVKELMDHHPWGCKLVLKLKKHLVSILGMILMAAVSRLGRLDDGHAKETDHDVPMVKFLRMNYFKQSCHTISLGWQIVLI